MRVRSSKTCPVLSRLVADRRKRLKKVGKEMFVCNGWEVREAFS